MSDTNIKQFVQDSLGLKPSLLKISDLNWRFAVRSVMRGTNLMVLGESGNGKTLLAKTIATVLNRPFFKFPMGHTNDPKSLLIGNTHFNKEQGTFVVDAEFVQAIQTRNAVVTLDELSRAHPNAQNILMPVLDYDQRELVLDTRIDTPRIKVADGVTFILTANVGTEYSATRTIDRALMDRCMILLMPSLSLEQEVELLTQMYPNMDTSLIAAIAGIADDTRQQVKSDAPKVDTIISTRMTVQMAALILDGFSLAEAAEICIYPFYSDAGGLDSPRTYITQRVQYHIAPETAPTTTDPFKNGDPNGGHKKPFR